MNELATPKPQPSEFRAGIGCRKRLRASARDDDVERAR